MTDNEGGRDRRHDIRHLRRLGRFLAGSKPQIAGALVALVMAAGTVLAFGAGLRWLVDVGFASGRPELLDQALLGMLGIVVVLALSTWMRASLVGWIGERVAADIRRAVFDRLLLLTPGWYEMTPVGEVVSRLTADTTLVQTVVGTAASMAARNVLMFAGGTVMMAVTSPRLTGLVFLVVPLVVAPLLFFGRRVRRLSRASQDRIGDLGAQIDETLVAIATVQAFGHEATDSRRFGARVEEAFATATRRIRARSALSATVILLVFTAVGIILWIGGHDMLAGRMSAGELSAFVFYAIIVAASVGVISEFLGDLQRAAGASERLMELAGTAPDIVAPATPVPLPEPARGAVAIEDVTFAWPSRPEAPALHDFSLTTAPGETVALVGPSGAGKSTVFHLLLRFCDPDSGTVRFDGVDLREADPAALRARIGLVPQDPVVFAGDAAENIAYSRPDASREEIRQAARAAAADGFIEALPEGYGTFLGERGVRLSGGQRQRIAIARAILRDPALLLLDEATSALDAESEQAVQQALEGLMAGRTTIIIAHRLATVQKADRIIVMDAGRIVGEGSHAELMAEGGLYARLATMQFSENRAGPGGRG